MPGVNTPSTIQRSARVYDPVLRVLHWVNALLIVLLLASGLVAWGAEPGAASAWLHARHGVLGGVLLVGLSARLAWAFVGTPHALLIDLWQPGAWKQVFAQRRLFTPPTRFGHHASASLAYLLLYALLLMLGISGLILLATEQGAGPLSQWLAWHVAIGHWPGALHTWLAWMVLAFVLIHLGALALHPRLHKVPVAQAMLTGVQYLPAPIPDKQS